MTRPGAAADLAAAIVAVDPHAVGGVRLRGPPGPARDRWLKRFAEVCGGLPLRRMPAQASEDRIVGGLDLAATLRTGRRVSERGLLAAAHGGVLVLAMAERASPTIASHLAAALDEGIVRVQRDGLSERWPARIGVVALDEGLEDEAPPPALTDRLALWIDPDAEGEDAPPFDAEAVAAARTRAARVTTPAAIYAALCEAAAALGIASCRPPLLAVRVARLHAALAGRGVVAEEDAVAAVRFVLAPRATAAPVAPEQPEAEPPPPGPAPEDAQEGAERDGERPLADRLVEAARAALPADLLAQLAAGVRVRGGAAGHGGRQGRGRAAPDHGRPAGVAPGDPRRGRRLALLDTLRAAAPWQRLRGGAGRGGAGLDVRRDDLRVRRFERPQRATTVFVVDASGSTAAGRLAEAKGAVELLLASCYVRRDEVALLAMRGGGAEMLLPPTRSLARARRALASLPGGGGTPLAAGIDAAAALADAVARKGGAPLIVFLTDGQGNVARDGRTGREAAGADALVAGRALRAAGRPSILVDTSLRPRPGARDLAAAMGARYVPLPQADAQHIVRSIFDFKS
jgi:magnesium chelatase subunit D